MKKSCVFAFAMLFVMVANAQHARRCMAQRYDGLTGCYYAGDAGSGLGFCSCTVIHTPGTCYTDSGVEIWDEADTPDNVICAHPCPSSNVCIIGRSAETAATKHKPQQGVTVVLAEKLK